MRNITKGDIVKIYEGAAILHTKSHGLGLQAASGSSGKEMTVKHIQREILTVFDGHLFSDKEIQVRACDVWVVKSKKDDKFTQALDDMDKLVLVLREAHKKS